MKLARACKSECCPRIGTVWRRNNDGPSDDGQLKPPKFQFRRFEENHQITSQLIRGGGSAGSFFQKNAFFMISLFSSKFDFNFLLNFISIFDIFFEFSVFPRQFYLQMFTRLFNLCCKSHRPAARAEPRRWPPASRPARFGLKFKVAPDP